MEGKNGKANGQQNILSMATAKTVMAMAGHLWVKMRERERDATKKSTTITLESIKVKETQKECLKKGYNV